MLRKEARARAPDYATQHFNKEHLPRILEKKFPPVDTLCLRGDVLWAVVFRFALTSSALEMHKIGQEKAIQTAMWDLVMKTVDAPNSDISKQLLVSVQRVNVELCMKYAAEK